MVYHALLHELPCIALPSWLKACRGNAMSHGIHIMALPWLLRWNCHTMPWANTMLWASIMAMPWCFSWHAIKERAVKPHHGIAMDIHGTPQGIGMKHHDEIRGRV